MTGDEDLISEARRVTEELREAALLLEQFTARLGRLTAELKWEEVDGERGDESGRGRGV